MCKCASSSEPWLPVAYVMNSSLTFKLLIDQNWPFSFDLILYVPSTIFQLYRDGAILLLIILFVW